jgi:hypothetical protein
LLEFPDRCRMVDHASNVSEGEIFTEQLSEGLRRAELDYREARYRKSPAGVVPWEQIKTDLLKKR